MIKSGLSTLMIFSIFSDDPEISGLSADDLLDKFSEDPESYGLSADDLLQISDTECRLGVREIVEVTRRQNWCLRIQGKSFLVT